jgi:3-hydroxybutyryl-CoA dehydrogenase
MKIQHLFVAGAGQMGAGIAQVAATSGFVVKLYDLTMELAQSAHAKIAKNLARQVEKGRMTQQEMDAALGAITPVGTLDAAADCHIAIEAASEQPEIKAQLFQTLDRVMGKEALLLSNTSSLSITTIAAATGRPTQVAGMHFFNPAPVMKLVEVVRGLRTSDETIAAVREFAVALGKTPVVCKDSPGFVVNRLLDPMLNEAAYLVQEGVATPEEIDLAMVNGLNHPMGPLALSDLIGVDVLYAVMQVLHQQTGDQKYRPCPLLRQMVDAGLLGRKAGRGFYEYE